MSLHGWQKSPRHWRPPGHAPELVAGFLTRCLFTMFAEDVGLLPRTSDGKGAFIELLKRFRDDPATLGRMLHILWQDMDRGGFSAALTKDVLRFNGKLFKQPDVLPLQKAQIDLLIDAAEANWTEVEPAIFGTLLERALDPAERHSLGAHYTPRAYVERLVLPAVVYAPFGLTQLPSAVPPPQVLVSVALLGLVCTALAFILFFALIAEVGPVRATVITYVNPACRARARGRAPW